MKNKLIVSLLLILLVAISASAASASEDTADAIAETSDISDIESVNEDVSDSQTISESLNEEGLIGEDADSDDKLGDGGLNIQNTVKIDTLSQFKTYVGSDKYDPGTIYKLNGTVQFNLTEPQNIIRSCTIKGGTLKAENLDYFFNVESPSNGGPSSVTIKDATFIITKEQSVVMLNGEYAGYNRVLDIAGITLENITFQIEEGIDPSHVSLAHIDKLPLENTYSNEINIANNQLGNANSLNIAGVPSIGNIHFDATEIIEEKATRIVLNSNVIQYAVDSAVGDSPFPFEVKLVDQYYHPVVNKTVSFTLDGIDKILTAVTDSNGVASLALSLNVTGVYSIYSIFQGEGEYKPSNMVVNTITINKKVSSLTVKNLSYKVTAAKKLTATFRDQNRKLIKNKKVSFTVNGKTYSATTNSKGVATVKITLNKKGTYTYTAKFAGDKLYSAVTKKAKLTVKPLATSLTTKKYTFKSAAKTKKLTTTLKSGKTALKSQKISFKVNGKTYTAKTNSKGVATVKIALTKKGTFTYSVKYAGNNKYSAVTKKNKVVIK